MPVATTNGLSIAYETAGKPDDPPLLLVMGLGAQLVHWPPGFVTALAEAGFFVVLYDNRDTGLSSRVDAPAVDLLTALSGAAGPPPYTLRDMAADGIGLLDALGIDRAHVVGMSLGGMIAQHMALDWRPRLRSLATIMSGSGDPAAEPPTPEASAALFAATPTSRESAMDYAVQVLRVVGSPAYPMDEAAVRERAGLAWDRGHNPAGVIRHTLAGLAMGDLRPRLRELDLPTVVIHGDSDPLVRPDAGEATARAVPGARWVLLPGMGHDLPEPLWPRIVAEVVANAQREPGAAAAAG